MTRAVNTRRGGAVIALLLAVACTVAEVSHAQPQEQQRERGDATKALHRKEDALTQRRSQRQRQRQQHGGGGRRGGSGSDLGDGPVSRENTRELEEAHLGMLPPVEFGADDTFPRDFIFGVSASSFQIEGDGGERPRSVWDDFADGSELGDDARAGIRHFEHFAGDVKYMSDAGVEHYRLSLSWPRLMNPDQTPREEGYAFYKNLLAEMKANGITPYVTLFHWDLPSFLCDRTARAGDATVGAVDTTAEGAKLACAGAWLDPGVVEIFATYAEQAFERLGPSVRFWATINEPKTVVNLGYGVGAHAPGIQSSTAPLVAAHNMLLAHAAAAKVYRERFQASQGGVVTIVLNCDWREPRDPDSPADVAAATRAMEEEMGWFADPLYKGDYPQSMRDRYGDALPRFSPEQSASVMGSADYFALNHYSSRYVTAADLSPAHSYLGRAVDWVETETAMDGTPIGPDASSAWLKQVPWGIRKTLTHVKDRYGNPPTYVTENGVSVNPPEGSTLEEQLDDAERVNYMRGYLSEVLAAVKSGCDVRGYFHWSFFDNFEWAEGSASRFGMVHVDFKGEFGGEWMRRRAKRSLSAYREFMAGEHSEGGAGARAGDVGADVEDPTTPLGVSETTPTSSSASAAAGEGGGGPSGSLYVYPLYPLAALGDGTRSPADGGGGGGDAAGRGADGGAAKEEVEEGLYAHTNILRYHRDPRDAGRAEVRRLAVAALGSAVVGLDGRVTSSPADSAAQPPETRESPEPPETPETPEAAETAEAAEAEEVVPAVNLDDMFTDAAETFAADQEEVLEEEQKEEEEEEEDAPLSYGKVADGTSISRRSRKKSSKSKAGSMGKSEGTGGDAEPGNNSEDEEKVADDFVGADMDKAGVRFATKPAKDSAVERKKIAKHDVDRVKVADKEKVARESRDLARRAARGNSAHSLLRRRGEVGEVGVGWGPLASKMWWVRWGPAAVAACAGVTAGVLLIAVQVSCNALVQRRRGEQSWSGEAGGIEGCSYGHTVRGGGGVGVGGGRTGAEQKRRHPEVRGLISTGTAPSYGV